ncbi:UDP-N-acetylglucosamine 1-carboxyvinyltransferase [Nakamurella endophytica]|uniref:UDP-N-acetylglucosamine 1-carboxyvinyltransferase n=1 Tax=Nakamurella endophytica TaxID=1748367 RepID=A0A917WP14_9ACTN|nr:UDP-N-acetylglucosamine 1-carboxyvinyltransferase [Nakamurella endophytica]GGM17893.1 UDP-N-acetylglucosamine 1-carboxyvinyltransferase [Nakamurella endophytica]
MDDTFLVAGGARLDGHVRVAGAKNSVLKLMAAALLAEGTTVLTNAPAILDVPLMADVLGGLGCIVKISGDEVSITVPADLAWAADFPAVGRLRASVCVLGPLMGRCLRARVALPGGDAIGSRPLDMHQSGLRAMGARMAIEHGFVIGEADGLHGADIVLDFPSVGATENILMAAVLARGTTTIRNAAREPEIVDLAVMLGQMGARVTGAGSATITIEGVDQLRPTEHRTVGDRVVGGTWAYAAVMTRGRIRVEGVDAAHLSAPLDRLSEAGASIAVEPDGFLVDMAGRPRAVDVLTMPYPGFPTDLQPMALALAAVADGHSLITENVFEARFRFVDELIRMGADARTDGHHASLRGRERLSSAPVWATDIRAGAGLVLAGLVAEGVTQVHEVGHIDRGYPWFVEDLQALGADVQRVAG